MDLGLGHMGGNGGAVTCWRNLHKSNYIDVITVVSSVILNSYMYRERTT